MFLSEKLVARRRQIQVLAQGTPRIFGTEETATLQFGNDQSNEILEPFGRYRRSDHQAVASSRHIPILHLVGDLGSTALPGRTDGERDHRMVGLAEGQVAGFDKAGRTEERRGGNECGSKSRTWGTPYMEKNTRIE